MLITDTESVLDRRQLRDVTLDDPDLMREILEILLDDTSQQVVFLEKAVREADAEKCARVAHYCKGACANVGARRAAEALLHIERRAMAGDIQECSESLPGLARELEALRVEAAVAVTG